MQFTGNAMHGAGFCFAKTVHSSALTATLAP
jgi:hypothetical protein